MRGEKQQEEMSNRKVSGSAFSVVDAQGNIQYHVVSTWWAKGIMIGFLLIILICILFTVLIYDNQNQIQTLQQQVNEEQPCIGGQTNGCH